MEYFPAIVLWELAKLAQLERIELDIKSPDFGRILSGIHVWQLDLEVCRQIRLLDFSSDPADENHRRDQRSSSCPAGDQGQANPSIESGTPGISPWGGHSWPQPSSGGSPAASFTTRFLDWTLRLPFDR
jgi:hypothetical protein